MWCALLFHKALFITHIHNRKVVFFKFISFSYKVSCYPWVKYMPSTMVILNINNKANLYPSSISWKVSSLSKYLNVDVIFSTAFMFANWSLLYTFLWQSVGFTRSAHQAFVIANVYIRNNPPICSVHKHRGILVSGPSKEDFIRDPALFLISVCSLYNDYQQLYLHFFPDDSYSSSSGIGLNSINSLSIWN